MKFFLLCMSVIVLAISATLLPLTDASDDPKLASQGSEQRRETAQPRSTPRQSSTTQRGSFPQRRSTPQLRDSASSQRLAQANPGRADLSKRKVAATPAADREQATSGAAAKAKRQVPVTAEMEAEVGKFVSEHHRELVDVLARLKANVPEEYERAVRDLNRNRLRLQQLEGRERYADELELWKALSRARLLGAKVQMGNDEALREALSQSLAKIYDLRAKLVQQDRDRAAERLKRLDEQLETLRRDRDENLEKQFIALTKVSPDRPKPVTTNARGEKPAANQKNPIKKSSAKTIE